MYSVKFTRASIGYMQSDTDIPAHIKDSVILQVRICFFADGIIGIYKRWFKGEISCSLNDLALQLSKIVAQSAQDFLSQK